ncbi:MAG TPA: CoA transferase [Pseudonocardiaceae bacterium]|nr:CoA transferase [Pseudonocardiaceae bacterium]
MNRPIRVEQGDDHHGLPGGSMPVREQPWRSSAIDPLFGACRTAADRWLVVSMRQPGWHWPEFRRLVGQDDLVTDARNGNVRKVTAHGTEAAEIVGRQTYTQWGETLSQAQRQWAAVQNAWEMRQGASLSTSGPVVPQLAEHTVEVLREPCLPDEALTQLKVDRTATRRPVGPLPPDPLPTPWKHIT